MNKRKETIGCIAAIIFTLVYGSVIASCTAYNGPELKGFETSHTTTARVFKKEKPKEKKYILEDEDRYAIAKLVMAEANSESELGQRLVIDTVLNRVDSEHFPDTIHDVIWQKGQFAANASLKWDAPDYILDLVDEESKERTNSEVVFFNAISFTEYGDALFKEGGHYFSKYKE